MRQLLAVALSGIMVFTPVSETNNLITGNNIIVVNDIGTTEKTSELSISSKTAVCKSSCRKGAEPIKSITAVQTLEKRYGNGRYSAVANANWSKTVNAELLSMRNSISLLSVGTYRLKTVFTVKYKDGRSETVTVYSTETTVK